MSGEETFLWDHLAALVADVQPDEIWQDRLRSGIADRGHPLRRWLALSVCVLAAMTTVFVVATGHQGPTDQTIADRGLRAGLPDWASGQLVAPGSAARATSVTKLGTIRVDGGRTHLVRLSDGEIVEVTGLADDLKSPPQWTRNSTLVLLQPLKGCPVVADLHPFGAVEPVMRQCRALALSNNGTQVLLGKYDRDRRGGTSIGILDLAAGHLSQFDEPITFTGRFGGG